MTDSLLAIIRTPHCPNSHYIITIRSHQLTNSQQGGSQALEDGQTLALLLSSLIENRSQDEAIQISIQGLFDIRAEHTYELKAKGLAIKEPQRPWSWTTTALVYAFYFGMTKAKWLSGLFGQPVYPAHLFDAKKEVAKYIAAKSQAT